MKTPIFTGVVTGVTIFMLKVSSTEQYQESTTTSSGSRPVDWFSCDGRVGNLLHPTDCTRFIQCAASGQAFEFDCPACDNDPDRCSKDNRLVYNVTVDRCLWTDETECISGVGANFLNFYVGLVSMLLGILVLVG